jgi:alpha-tubulin suppressor-like RCC1 family protein
LRGKLGEGTIINRLTPVDVVGLSSGEAAVSAGNDHTCALTTAGGLKCSERNRDRQLGDGTATARITPVDVFGLANGVAAVVAGGGHTCIVTTLDGVEYWG